MTNWFVLFTDSRCEQETAHDIQTDTGFEAYTPIELYKTFRRGQKAIVARALFPRYLFARFDPSDNWPALLDVDGVRDVLRNNGSPSPLPDVIVPKLQRMQQLGLFDHTKSPNPFPPGSSAMTDDDGPFAELIGKVLRVRTGDRVDLLIRYLNKEMTINISMARLSHMIHRSFGLEVGQIRAHA
jgi:transcriptional antiterminator RfaH